MPNFLAVEEAVGNITFPISKRELMDTLGDGTVLFEGKNVDLHDLVRDLNDDYFESEGEFRTALEMQYGNLLRDDADADPMPLGTGPRSSLQSRWGPGASGAADEYLEP